MSKLLEIIKEELDKLSLDSIRQYLINYFHLNNVIEPSSLPIKDGNVRLFHQTNKENFENIKKDGSIKINKSTGVENNEPTAIWGSEKGFYGSPKEQYTIEYQVPRNEVDVGTINRDIRPDEIIAYHDPTLFHIKNLVFDDDYLKTIAENPDFYLDFSDYGEGSEYAAYLIANAIINKRL